MTLAFGGSMPGMQYRRVRIDAVNEDATETSVSDGSGWRTTLDGSIRQKGTLPPEPNEIWIIERYGISWLLKVQERAGSPTLDPTDLAAITAEVERQLAEAAAHEALVASKEAALAAGIMDGDAVVLIQPTTPGPEHQNALTLWIDTTNDLNRPMRWENGQWVVVVDQIAMEAARRAVLAAQAAEAAEQRATDAEAAAAAAQQAAQDALAASQDAVAAATQMQADLVGVQGMIDGKSTIYPVGSNPTLGPEDVGDMRLLIDGGVEYWDGTAWQIADPRVAQAVNEAAEALGLANTKITTYYKATPPDASDIEPPETDFTVGDLWLRSPDNILHRWDGAAWIEFRDAGLVVIEGQISDLQDDLTGLEGKVDGKSTIYVQETAPVEVSGVEHTGDLWIDTSGGGRVYKAWDGTQWVVVDDPRVAEVLDEVSRKITTYYGTDAPTGTIQYPLVIGDLWLREPDNRTFRYDGANWVDVGDTRIFATEQALAAIQGDLIEMDGKIDGKAEVWFQPDDPSLGAVPAWDIAQMGDIWIDTSVPGEKTYKVWDSNSWETITDPAALAALERVNTRQVTYFASGTTAPSGPNFPPPEGYVVGDLWIRTEDKMVFRWDGASWVDATFIDSRVAAQATAITDIQDDLSGLEGRVDGKAVVWFQPTAPAGLGAADAGDIWIDSDAVPRTFQAWDGTGWVEITDQTALDALAGLEGKITTYYEAEAPVAPAEGFTTGDLWIRTADNRLHRWNGSDWVDLRDPGLNDAVTDYVLEYAVGSSETVAPSTGWSTDTPVRTHGTYIWFRTKVTYGDGTTTTTSPALLTGNTGAPGTPATPLYTWVKYAPSATPTAGQMSDSAEGMTHMGIAANQTSPTESTDPGVYTWSLIKGGDGKGITTTTVTYTASSSGTAIPTSGWVANPPTTTPGQYLWTKTEITYTDGSKVPAYSVAKHGDTGSEGKGISGTSVTYQTHTSGTATPTGSWAADPTPTNPGQYLWTKTEITYTDGSKSTSYAVSAHGATGSDGRGITGTQVTYQVASSGTTEPTGSWSTSIPATTPGQFLWTRTVTSYTTGSPTTAFSVAAHGTSGAAGRGISDTTVRYQVGNSGTTEPSGTWLTTIPTTTTGQYLWTRTVTTYTDSTTSTAYSVAAHGTSGNDGVGIESTEVTYQVGTSGTTPPTGTWLTTIPATTAGQFLWTRTVTTYTDDSTGTSYSVGAHGKDGAAAKVITLTASTQVLKQPSGGGPTTPATAQVVGTVQGGTSISTWDYSTDGGATFSTTAPTGVSRTGAAVTITGGTITSPSIVVRARDASGLEDRVTVARVADGAAGGAGADAYTVLLSNEAHTFAGTVSAAVAGSTTSTVTALKGATAQSVTVGAFTSGPTSGALPTGLSASVANNNTVAPVVTLSATTSLTATGGTVYFPVTFDGRTVTKSISWSVSRTGIGITSLTPYYLQQPAAATAPAKPTASPPPSPWTDTEPAYAPDTALWRTERVVYSNGVFAYTPVSRASAYDAAAQAAEAISNLQDDLASLDGKVDGRAVVYYQSTDPKDIPAPWGSNETGDVWIDISVPGQTTYKVWDGADWDTITDPVAVQALSTVQTKITTYYKATMPVLGDIQAPETAFRLGDLWIRTTDNRLHRYDGSTFVEVSDVRLSQQATAITNLQNDLSDLSTQVDGKAVIWFQPNAPAGLTVADAGDIWIDSDANPRTFKSWSGSGWVDVTDQTALDALAGLNGKITTYYAPEKAGPAPDHTPPSEGYTEGDLWMNATRGNAVYRYPGSGTAWTLLALGLETIVTDPNAAINPDVVEKLWTDVVRSRKITTDMLVVGSGDNLVPDPHLLDPDLSDARMAAGTGTPWSRVLVDGVNTFTAQVAGSNILPFLAAAGTDAERSHPVTPGKEYRVRFDYRAVGSGALNPTVYLRVIWVDAEGTATTDTLITDLAGGPTVWETYEATWTAPATAVAAHLVFEGGGISTWTHQVRGPEIVGKTDPALLVEGSIDVALNIAAGGKIISGDPNGTASEVGDHGYSVYRQVEDGRDLSTYLGHEGDQALLLTGSHEGQPVSSGVDSTGSLTVRTGSFTEDISVAGRPLLGQRHDAMGEEGWLDQIPTPVAWGDLKAANPTGPELTSAGGTAMIGYITFSVQAGRRYRFSMVYGLQATAVPSNGGRMGGHVKAEFYPYSGGGGVPAPLPTPPVDTSSPTIAEFQNIVAMPHVEYGNITGNWVAPADGRVAMGITLTALAGTGAKLHRGASEGWRLYVDDIGPFNLPDVAVAAAAPPKQTYTTYWAPSSVRVYQGAGNQSWGSYNGVSQVDKINQGSWHSGIVGRWGVAQFTGNAVSGDEQGVSITSALSGATVTKATLRVTSAYASARARIGWQSNWTNTPTLQHSSSVVPEGGRVTTTLPSTFHTWVKASTANRYITLGRNGNYTDDYMFVHGTTGGSSNRLLLAITYTK